MRFMWWANMDYWSTQGQVWQAAKADRTSDVVSAATGLPQRRPSDADRCCHQGRWFSWGPENCTGIPTCWGDPVRVPGVGCAQGSWGSLGSGSGIQSAMASFGSQEFADYMVDAMANSWSRNLGIDGYTEDVSWGYGCMMQVRENMPA